MFYGINWLCFFMCEINRVLISNKYVCYSFKLKLMLVCLI